MANELLDAALDRIYGSLVDRLRVPCATADSKEAADEIERLRDEIERLRAALDTLIKSAKPCPSCAPENECYVFSMVALAEASRAYKSSRLGKAARLTPARGNRPV